MLPLSPRWTSNAHTTIQWWGHRSRATRSSRGPGVARMSLLISLIRCDRACASSSRPTVWPLDGSSSTGMVSLTTSLKTYSSMRNASSLRHASWKAATRTFPKSLSSSSSSGPKHALQTRTHSKSNAAPSSTATLSALTARTGTWSHSMVSRALPVPRTITSSTTTWITRGTHPSSARRELSFCSVLPGSCATSMPEQPRSSQGRRPSTTPTVLHSLLSTIRTTTESTI
mmetsp:Transcript_55108/g.109407  ORF Transcript_55108/g.109407 Transcript_55108/m.109407 type:complete len:229 (+) Transcript_55108:2152-2838(+)